MQWTSYQSKDWICTEGAYLEDACTVRGELRGRSLDHTFRASIPILRLCSLTAMTNTQTLTNSNLLMNLKNVLLREILVDPWYIKEKQKSELVYKVLNSQFISQNSTNNYIYILQMKN